ncbi:MAG: hypothetical protein MUE68_05050 [Bacteroidetes bacterium]|jgi:hypothetical protein|nr:hypothetical protein [Bacteroidota bacterium]
MNAPGRSVLLQPLRTTVLSGIAGLSMIVGPACSDLSSGPPARTYPVIADPTPISMHDSALQRYVEDAYRLAARHMESTQMADVSIPEELYRSLLNGLTHLHRAVNLPARDSIVERYAIHTSASPMLHEVILYGLDTSCTWTSRLIARALPTGQPTVDSLFAAYDLTIKQVFGIGPSRFVLLRSSSPLHVSALSRRFSGIPCLVGAEPHGVSGDGNDISAEAETDAWKITFSLGWGDCPSGCIYRHFWRFRVRSDGRVEFLESGGSPIPVEGPLG